MKKNLRIKAILEGNDARAMAVVKAITMCLGERALGWEPETIRMELDDEGIDILPENFDAFMAVTTLRQTTDFFWDVTVFENACVALNGESPQEDIFHNIPPSYIANAVQQAYNIADASKEIEVPQDLERADWFDYGPIEYTVASCMDVGLITVPDRLAFARERLEETTKADEELLSEVKKAWNDLDSSRLRKHPYGEDPVGIQLALMASIELYVQEEREALEEQRELLED